MSLIVISKDEVSSVLDKLDKEDKRYVTFLNAEHVQKEFCDELEHDDRLDPSDPNKFLCKPIVAEYLASIGVKYTDETKRVLSKDLWTDVHKDGCFVTSLSYYVQAACVMLSHEAVNDFIVYSYGVLDPKFSAFVLQRKNVYYINDDPDIYMRLLDFIENGVDVVYHGRSFPANTENDFFCDLLHLSDHYKYISRELDNEVFENYLAEAKVHYPCRMPLGKFTGSEEDHSSDIEVILKGEFNFHDKVYRRYPMHRFYKIHDEWYYAPCNSVKYPNKSEILNETFLSEEIDYFGGNVDIDVSEATEVFALVLNRNEICDARHYWEYISFIGKYNKQSKTISILDKHAGLLAFHDLLQKSKDMTELNKNS